MIEILPFVLITFILLIFAISNRKKANIKRVQEIQQELLIAEKHLHHINNQIENRTLDKSLSFTQTQSDILDIYDNSNIRIPSDILEDLSHSNLYEYQDIFEYIENQRNYWKLENTKKPFRKKV